MTVEYLRELLQNNARIILPDFGAFLVKDDGSGVFKPENVSFSPFLRYNDGIMVDSLCKKLSISREESSKRLKNFIENIKDELLNKNEFEISGIGFLYRDNRGGIRFEAKALAIESVKDDVSKVEKFLPKTTTKTEKTEQKVTKEKKEVESISESEPEKVVAEEPVIKKKEVIKEVKTEKIKEKPAQPKNQKLKHVVEPSTKSESVTDRIEKPESADTGTGKAILIGSLIGIALVALVATGLYLNKQGFFDFKSDVENIEETTNDITTEEVETDITPPVEEVKEEKGKFDEEFDKLSKEMDKESKETVDDKPKEEISEQKSSSTETASGHEPKNAIPTSDGPFHLIVGSFRNPEYAEKFSADMRKSGYNSTVIIQSSGMHSVTLGSYTTRADAIKAMDQFKSQHPNVWLLTQ